MEKFDLLYLPVPDLKAALGFYRDTLGWKEGWREGETTATLQLPGVETQLMLDVDAEGRFRPGPILLCDSVPAFRKAHPELTFSLEPSEIPGGWWGAFDDPFGNPVYVLDQSSADEAAADG